jgi:hypothetical protein
MLRAFFAVLVVCVASLNTHARLGGHIIHGVSLTSECGAKCIGQFSIKNTTDRTLAVTLYPHVQHLNDIKHYETPEPTDAVLTIERSAWIGPHKTYTFKYRLMCLRFSCEAQILAQAVDKKGRGVDTAFVQEIDSCKEAQNARTESECTIK